MHSKCVGCVFEHDSGNIDISLKYLEPAVLQLYIADNGVGIPEDFDIENSSSLGLQLVQLLSEQISAELTIQHKNPTRFILNIPIQGVQPG
ncbi:MAG: hypothetical protein KF908_06830 [Nitrosomonas sp.]|nr:hypothetical protein [Nitrosomonas sp.]